MKICLKIKLKQSNKNSIHLSYLLNKNIIHRNFAIFYYSWLALNQIDSNYLEES